MPSALVRAAALVALVVAGIGCGDDDGSSPMPGSSTSSTAASTTSSATAGARCPEHDPAPGERTEPPRAADVDGDGRDDEVVVTVVDEGTIAVEADFAAGGRTVVTYDDDTVATFAPVRLARVADVDADGDDDLWVVVGSGATVEVVSLLLSEGCDLVRPDAGGRPNAFPVGASVGDVAGVECVDLDGDAELDGFLEHAGERTQGRTYRGSSTEWLVATGPPALQQGETTSFTTEAGSEGSTRYGELSCR